MNATATAKAEKLMKQLIKMPHLVLAKLDLVYVSNQQLTIERCKFEEGFIYKKRGGVLSKKAN